MMLKGIQAFHFLDIHIYLKIKILGIKLLFFLVHAPFCHFLSFWVSFFLTKTFSSNFVIIIRPEKLLKYLNFFLLFLSHGKEAIVVFNLLILP